MFHYVNAKTGESTITCHSSDPNLFKYISKATPALKVAKEQHQVIEKEDSEEDDFEDEENFDEEPTNEDLEELEEDLEGDEL